ncbi:coagulation factor V [Strongylocentrotus purpuratus]|uniref:Uncharacterized protein n=1 Tax=Strongylocentrotus purpuratus TaxID=7668 RepID=A0A7M7NNV4_STRPU|nr:coagulation factor V [Strongylocentrotus purpuratus]
MSSISTMPPSPMPAVEDNTNSMTTMAMMTTDEEINDSVTGGDIADLTTLAVPSQPQTTPSMNGDNVTITLSSSTTGNMTSTPDMGNTTSTLDMGNMTSTPDMGNSTLWPDTVNVTSNPVAENTTSLFDMGNSTSTPDMGNMTSPSNIENSTSPSDMRNATSSRDSNATETLTTGSMTTSEYVTVTFTSEYTDIVTDGLEDNNVTNATMTESNNTFTANTGNFTIMCKFTVQCLCLLVTTSEPETITDTDANDTRKRNGPSLPVALYMCISVILALCVVLLMGVIAHACASLRNRPTSYNISSRVNGHQNPAFDSGEVADDDEDNPVKGIMRGPRGDIESGMYNDNERTPL